MRGPSTVRISLINQHAIPYGHKHASNDGTQICLRKPSRSIMENRAVDQFHLRLRRVAHCMLSIRLVIPVSKMTITLKDVTVWNFTERIGENCSI